jgi:hypothetical protein
MWAGYDACNDPYGETVRGLVEFSIASIPADQVITEATLRVYLITSCDYEGASRTIRAYRITDNWSEGSVTWNNRPGYGGSYGSQSIVHSAWGWYEFDVTDLVSAWYDGTYTNHGIMLRGPEILGWRGFGTRDAPYEYRPQLVVEYVPNTSPTIAGLPDRTLPANSSLNDAINLWNYADDAESPDSDLTFTIDNTPNPNAGVSIDGDHYIDINPVSDWAGQTDVVIRVTDPGGLSNTDTFSVAIINSAPVIANLPDQTLEINASLDDAIDLWNYADDAESPDSDLIFTIDNTSDPQAGVSIDDNRYIDINPTPGWTGQTEVVVRVTDFGDLSSTDNFQVVVPSVEPTIVNITPNSGYNSEVVHITNLAGGNFQVTGTTTVTLAKVGEPDIYATNATVVSDTKITCDFDLRGATPGRWAVVVVNPDGQFADLPDAFTVKGVVYLPIVLRN